ncbi:hypothetical protein VCR5J5_730145 [Vibrio crassostreae]|uniref:Uncharacterized protein n=1 Tax=Vibrio crassostreae TaxID=246167 RepID=A0A822N632_9VIBR|nr:hypothetical protein VCR9J2_20063 [Vibrio crassostreae]CDT61882.1 hypothetical protein VCR5J5_730145 [Vibrio crassostreae]
MCLLNNIDKSGEIQKYSIELLLASSFSMQYCAFASVVLVRNGVYECLLFGLSYKN